MTNSELHGADAVWYNAHLITMNSITDYGLKENGAIVVKDGCIAYVGALTELELSELQQSRIPCIDLKGKFISPGLIDCHTHLIYGGNRATEFEQRLQGATYEEIARQGGGILSTVKATRAASHYELQVSALERIESLLNEGVTTLEIKSGYGLDLKSEIKMLEVCKSIAYQIPINLHPTFLGAHTLPPEFAGRPSEYISHLCDDVLPIIAEHQLASSVDAFCESIGFSVEDVETLFKRATDLGFRVKLHAEQLSNLGGTEMATKYSALSADHLEFCDETAIKAMAESGTVAVLLPGAFYFLRETQLPPVDLLRKYSVPMAIATDSNPGSSPCTSLLLMLNMACTLFRMTPQEALSGVTIHAAKALAVESEVGSLEIGKKADFAIWNIQSPAELCYAFGANPCVGVIKDGKIVLDKIH